MKPHDVCKSIFLTALAALLGLSAPALADEPDTALTSEEVVVSATRVDKELLDVPMSVSVVTKDEIEKSPARTVGELLQDVPGVRLHKSGGQGINRISIRGEDTTRTLVLIDGQKISEQKSMDGTPLLIDPSIIERIEVIKGPASVLYGSEAMGGVVNIITKKGGTRPIQGQAGIGFNGATGGFDENLSLYGAMDGWKYRVSGSNTYQFGVRTPDGIADHSKFEQRGGSAFLSYDFNEHLTAGAGYDMFYSEIMAGSVDMPEFYVDINPWEREKASVFLEAKHLASWLPRLRFDAFWQQTHKDMHNHVEQMNGAVIVDPHADNWARQLGLSLQADWAIGENNYLITGYEFLSDALDSTGRTDSHIDMAVSPRMTLRSQGMDTNEFQGLMTTHALFAQMETKLPWDFTLTYGARQTWVNSAMSKARGWEYSRTTPYMMGRPLGTVITDQPAEVGATGSEWDSRPVFNASLMWQGIENLTLRAGWAQGFRVASLADRYVTSSMGGGTILPNPSLEPEYSNNWEIGARYSDHGLNLDAVFFYGIADNYITSVYIDAANDVTQNVNVGKAYTHGAEFAVSYDLPYGFTPYVSATYLRRLFDYGYFKTWNSGTPTWTGRFGLRARHEFNKELEVTGDVYGRFASASKSESMDTKTDKVEATRYHAWTTANAAVGVNFGEEKQYSVTAEVLNIFNEKYMIDGAIYEPGVHANLKFTVEF
ncbi:TonB-dependent receptor [uncultured Desulfovibrio sp.]|uniref:TonB-dependent receptor plug domain-containing protein n=1 Tax=uncultured Desulfovibrio sp. TaxID=167968 RepID=UPI0026339B4D|nr:TonB-dependent receptor [uncultured Desulfovibrio sp.]